MAIITLTTDYGTKDHFAGALKGKLYTRFPDAVLVDISHQIDPFNIAEASYITSVSYKNFPENTVHFIGVDMEVSAENIPVAMQWNNHYFLAANNGILGMILGSETPQQLVALPISDTSSETLFIQAAIALAQGKPLASLGTPINTLKVLTEQQPVISEDLSSIKAYVIYIDNFGNVVTNVTKTIFEKARKGRNFEILLNEKRKYSTPIRLKTIIEKYSDIAQNSNFNLKDFEGDKLAIFNEAGYLEIAIFRSNPATVGSAASLYGLSYRDAITINFLTT